MRLLGNIKQVAHKLSEYYKDFGHHNKKNPLNELLYIICSLKTRENRYSNGVGLMHGVGQLNGGEEHAVHFLVDVGLAEPFGLLAALGRIVRCELAPEQSVAMFRQRGRDRRADRFKDLAFAETGDEQAESERTLSVEKTHERAGALAADNESRVFQFAQGFADRGPRDAETCAEGRFAGEPLSGFIGSVLDAGSEEFDDACVFGHSHERCSRVFH